MLVFTSKMTGAFLSLPGTELILQIQLNCLETVGNSSLWGMGKSPHLVISTGKRQAPVFDVFEAFLNTDSIQVFANAATSYIMCLMKFVKGLGKCFYFPYILLTYAMSNLILPKMRILLCNTEYCREKRSSVSVSQE